MKNTNIKTASGKITGYGLACGYVETHEKEAKKVELYMEHECYHVRFFDKGQQIKWIEWNSTRSLTIARKMFALVKVIYFGKNAEKIAQAKKELTELNEKA